MALHRYSVAVDTETHEAIQQDRVMLGAHMGADLNMSQYFRIVLAQRLQHVDPHVAGWREGALSAYGTFRRGIEEIMKQLMNGHPVIE